MSAEQGETPPSGEEAPSPAEAVSSGSEDIPAADPGEQALPRPEEEVGEEEALLEQALGEAISLREAVSGEDEVSLSEKRPAPSASGILNLFPSDGQIILPDDDELDIERNIPRLRPRPAPRMVQSVLSEIVFPSTRPSKYRRSMSGIPNLQETLKEKQVLLIIKSFHLCHFHFK